MSRLSSEHPESFLGRFSRHQDGGTGKEGGGGVGERIFFFFFNLNMLKKFWMKQFPHNNFVLGL